MNIRPANESESQLLSELALRSKGLWGYSREFLETCRAELTITEEYIRASEVFVLETSGTVIGFYSIFGQVQSASLDFLYVYPEYVGKGYGKALWRHAVHHAKLLGFNHFSIDGDPHAQAFYLRMGAERVGEVPSGSIPGRMLPQFRYELDSATLLS